MAPSGVNDRNRRFPTVDLTQPIHFLAIILEHNRVIHPQLLPAKLEARLVHVHYRDLGLGDL